MHCPVVCVAAARPPGLHSNTTNDSHSNMNSNTNNNTIDTNGATTTTTTITTATTTNTNNINDNHNTPQGESLVSSPVYEFTESCFKAK